MTQFLACHRDNYRPGRSGGVRYLVLHYVGALGGAEENARYYASRPVGSSAHYFVGFDGEIWQSVREEDTAWHCGGGLQGAGGHRFFGLCKNDNSIGIELCVRKKDKSSLGARDPDWYFEEKTLSAAARLCRGLMDKYSLPPERVIRHYDVTGKYCPNPFVRDEEQWRRFRRRLGKEEESMARYDTLSQIPEWGRDTVKKLCDEELLTGGGKKDARGYPADLNLSEDMIRVFVVNDRAGLYE